MSDSKTYGLTHLAIAVKDVQRTKEFYRTIFGMETMYDEQGFVQMTTPGCHDVIVFEQKIILTSESQAVLFILVLD